MCHRGTAAEFEVLKTARSGLFTINQQKPDTAMRAINATLSAVSHTDFQLLVA